MKSGWKTSEFWISAFTVVGILGGAVAVLPISGAASIAAGVASGSYAIARAISKLAGKPDPQ